MKKLKLVDNTSPESIRDEILALEPALAANKKATLDNESEYQALRSKLFQLFDRLVGENGTFRLLTSSMGTLMVIGRTLSPSEPNEVVDIDGLRARIGNEAWLAVSDEGRRILNQEKLYEAITNGLVRLEDVEAFTTVAPQVPKLRYSKATAEERASFEEANRNQKQA